MGVRVLKYPVPFVTDFASTAGFKSNQNIEEDGINPFRSIDQKDIAYVGFNQLKITV